MNTNSNTQNNRENLNRVNNSNTQAAPTYCPDYDPTEPQGAVVAAAQEEAREYLRRHQPFIWNATNLSPMVRVKQIKLFTQYHASVRIIYLETEWSEQLRRNTSRPDAVPQQAICHMMAELVLPEAKEAQQVQWHTI